MTKTIITAKQSTFIKMLDMLVGATKSRKTYFGEVILELTTDTINCKATDSDRTIFLVSEFRNFTVKTTKKGMSIAISPLTWLKYMNTLFSPDDEITVECEEHTIKIIGPKDQATIPATDPELVNSKVDVIPFKLDDNVPSYKKGTIKATTIVEIDVNIMRELMKRAQLVGQYFYPLSFQTPNKFTPTVGDVTRRDSATITSTFDNLVVEGENLDVILAEGFEVIFNSLDGVVKLHGKTNFPLWVVKETQDYTVGFMVAPRKELSD